MKGRCPEVIGRQNMPGDHWITKANGSRTISTSCRLGRTGQRISVGVPRAIPAFNGVRVGEEEFKAVLNAPFVLANVLKLPEFSGRYI